MAATAAWFALARHDSPPAPPTVAPVPPTDPPPRPAPTAPPAPADSPASLPAAGDAPLGDGGKKALEAERAGRKAAEDARRELQAQLAALQPLTDLMEKIRGGEGVPDAQKTEVEKLAERLTAAEQTAADERLARLRLEVAGEKGLTPAQAARLAGVSKEELAADADTLLTLFPKPAEPPTPPAPPAGQLRPDPGQGGGREGSPQDFRTADQSVVNTELAKLGIRPRNR